MCIRDSYQAAFGNTLSIDQPECVFPGDIAAFIRVPFGPNEDEEAKYRETRPGSFGLKTHKMDLMDGHKLAPCVAQADRLAEDPRFHDAWQMHRHCLIPAESIILRTFAHGRPALKRVRRADGLPLALAGLWHGEKIDERWEYSFVALSLAADRSELLPFSVESQPSGLMPVIVPEGAYDDWLTAPVKQSHHYMHPYPAERLVSESLTRTPGT